MDAHVHGVYDNISETYKAVLQLIGTGWNKNQLILITSALAVNDDEGNELDRQQAIRQKSLLETVFPLRNYSQNYFSGLSDDHKAMLLPYQADLEAGRVVLVVSASGTL
ncbi:hypothetical protein ACKQTC_09045 [Peptococcus simiae]|uniref:Uncharacterized protein n=1 Tax=Peptococcus simiae TaxID=1643805 RepID=A0ABW9H3C2_9FIRM